MGIERSQGILRRFKVFIHWYYGLVDHFDFLKDPIFMPQSRFNIFLLSFMNF